ncbi:MAG TPA: endo-1,4-beta-xylanase [Candidatus Paceibacterota bacterium]|nr:endo-1,4-beta-xylanase [Candidatus Paceibacterota bacterium]
MSKKKIALIVVVVLAAFGAFLYFTNGPKFPRADMQYGLSFGILRAQDEGLDWKAVYNSILNDLKVKRLRLVAYWPLIEPKKGTYDFKDMDYQMQEASAHKAQVILAVGRRVPGWPECHDPDWLGQYSLDQQNQMLLDEVKTVVERYKDSPALQTWQVENEPFFDAFTRSRDWCPPFDSALLKKEIALVRQLDPSHPILVTDSGELGTWFGAYNAGDQFGTSIYLYVWNNDLGFIHYPIGAWFFRLKLGLTRLIFGDKPALAIEVQSEPWIPRALDEVPVDEQIQHFDMSRMNELIEQSYESGFQSAYLWGASWWYWMKQHGHPEFWDRARQLYSTSK